MLKPSVIIEKALIRAFPGQSEAAKTLYRHELASWLKEAQTTLARNILAKHRLDRSDMSFRAFQRTYSASLGLRDHLLTWSEQQMYSTARGWNWSAQGDNDPIITVKRTPTETTITGVLNSMIAANEMLAAHVVGEGQPARPVANNYVEFIWDSNEPVALALFPEEVTPTTSWLDVNALLAVLVEASGKVAVYAGGDNLVNPDITVMMEKGSRVRAEFARDGSITIKVYDTNDVEFGSYAVQRWFPGGVGDGATAAFAATTELATSARMVAVKLAPSGGTAPVLTSWQEAEAEGEQITFLPGQIAIGNYLLASLSFEQVHTVTADGQNQGDLMPTIEGLWTSGGEFNASDLAIEVVDASNFRWSNTASPAWTTVAFATNLTALGATGLSIRWNKTEASDEELSNAYTVTPFKLKAPSGWTLIQASADTDNYVNAVYGHFLTAQDREFCFIANAEIKAMTCFSAYSGVHASTPVAQSAKAASVNATTHQVALGSAPTTTQTVALFFSNADGYRFLHTYVDITPHKITESAVPVLQFGNDGAQVKNVRIGMFDSACVPLPRDYPFILESLYEVGNVKFANGKSLAYVGESATRPRVAGLWVYTIENNTIRIAPAIPSPTATPPSSHLLITGCVALGSEDLQAGYDNELIEILIAVARERAGGKKMAKA